jgi:hypothetical protein
VQPGDVLGVRMDTAGGTCLLLTGNPADVVRYNNTASDPVDGSPQMLNNQLTDFRVLVAATVEPDCDHDGLGDETQDPDVSSCAPPVTPAAIGQRAAAKKHCKKKFRHDKRKRKKCLRKAKRLPV